MNNLLVFFTSVSCQGKRTVFYKQVESVTFKKICAWYVLAFQKNHAKKATAQGVFICFPVISLKFVIANWDALIPFLPVSFFCLKSQNLLFNFFFFLTCGATSNVQNREHGVVAPLPPLKPLVSSPYVIDGC